jgi:NAD(P)H dehydrogenase (quinone)
MTDILVVHGHPNQDSLSTALAQAYTDSVHAHGGHTTRLALRELAFDPILHHGYVGTQPLEPDLERAAEAILRAKHVAWFMPCWWNGVPALVKGFVERVFTPGFAFRYTDHAKLPEKLLGGRSARVVASMDSPYVWHKLVNRSAFETSFARSTLQFVGFSPVRTTMLYSVRSKSVTEHEQTFAKMRAFGANDASTVARRLPPKVTAFAQ